MYENYEQNDHLASPKSLYNNCHSDVKFQRIYLQKNELQYLEAPWPDSMISPYSEML